MLLDLSPLLRHRDYRRLYAGQFVSAFGNFLTIVAIPVQIYDLTGSSATVGMLGAVQLAPLAVTALWGGAFADALDRRKLLLGAEAILMACSTALAVNAAMPRPSVALVFVIAGIMSAVSGFHTPALESLTPRLVSLEDLPAVSALRSLYSTTASIAGPALAGVCIAAAGATLTYALDAATFAFSLAAVSGIRAMPPPEGARPAGVSTILEGLRYAVSRPELLGTYLVDITAMTFAMPMAVFPALAAQWGASSRAGYLFSAMSAGALAVTLTSAWTKKVKRRGAAVVLAAGTWGLAVTALGFAGSLPVAMGCLALAGAADMVSGLFRMTIWNETIPSEIRGRMAGIEQLSYMTGPLLGNARAGLAAQRFGLSRSIAWGGAVCVLGVAATVPLLRGFWRYRAGEERA